VKSSADAIYLSIYLRNNGGGKIKFFL